VVVPPVATPDDPDAAPGSAPLRVKTPPPAPEEPAKRRKPEPNDEPSRLKGDVPTPQSNGVNGTGHAARVGNGTAI